MRAPFQLLAGVFTFLLAAPLLAYDYPLSQEAIRDAYTLGTRQTSLGANFLSAYTNAIPDLSVGDYASSVTIETPFTHVAIHAGKMLNYSAQDAIQEFYGKPMTFRIHLEICYMVDAPSDAIEVTILQNKDEIDPDSEDRSGYFPATDVYDRSPRIGETIDLGFKAERIDASSLKIIIDTPDGQHAESSFDLSSLR